MFNFHRSKPRGKWERASKRSHRNYERRLRNADKMVRGKWYTLTVPLNSTYNWMSGGMILAEPHYGARVMAKPSSGAMILFLEAVPGVFPEYKNSDMEWRFMKVAYLDIVGYLACGTKKQHSFHPSHFLQRVFGL